MKELIKITEYSGKKAVSARELYSFLSIDDGSHFTRWAKTNIVDMFTESVDYQTLRHNGAGRPSTDYAMAIDVAKEVAMMSRCSLGKQARQYFIECEKKLNEQNALPDFSNPAIAARAWAEQYEAKSIAEARLKDQQPKIEAFNTLMDSDVAISIGQFAKMVGIGRNTIFKKCREFGIFISSGREKNNPKQQYMNQGYFEVIEKPFEVTEDKTIITQQTLITPKGQKWLLGVFHKMGIKK